MMKRSSIFLGAIAILLAAGNQIQATELAAKGAFNAASAGGSLAAHVGRSLATAQLLPIPFTNRYTSLSRALPVAGVLWLASKFLPEREKERVSRVLKTCGILYAGYTVLSNRQAVLDGINGLHTQMTANHQANQARFTNLDNSVSAAQKGVQQVQSGVDTANDAIAALSRTHTENHQANQARFNTIDQNAAAAQQAAANNHAATQRGLKNLQMFGLLTFLHQRQAHQALGKLVATGFAGVNRNMNAMEDNIVSRVVRGVQTAGSTPQNNRFVPHNYGVPTAAH